MSRSLSSTATQAVNNQETNEVFIILLEIDHSSLSEPVRLTSNNVDTVHLTNTYVACPFSIDLPADQENQISEVRLIIENVSRQLIPLIRTVSTPPTINVKIVLASDPDTIEASFLGYTLADINYNALAVQGRFSKENFLAEPYPSRLVLPSTFAGAF